MTGQKNLITILLCCTAPCFQALAHTTIEPPVQTHTKKKLYDYDFSNTTTLESNVVWRGLSLTNQQPGWTSLNTGLWQRKYFTTSATYNLYSYASNTSPENGGIITNSPAGTTATTTYLMTEAKIGTDLVIGRKPKHKVKVGINRVVYQWPGGSNWLWTGSECASTDNNLLSKSQSISAIKTTEYGAAWQGFSLLYAVADKSTAPTISGTTQGTNPVAYNAPLGIYWGDYSVFRTPTYDYRDYSFDFSASYWESIGHNYQANIYYHFNKSISGVIKLFDLIGADGVDNNHGASGILQFKYQASNSK